MTAIINVLTTIFWGVVVLSVLVFVHEGGHFLAARACGVRVTEFFLGLPCRWRLSRASKRIGTRFGVTPLLLGGYAAICGMDPDNQPLAAPVLSAIHRHGTVSVDDLAAELDASPEDVMDACVLLLGWGSIAPVYDADKGEHPASAYYPTAYAAMPRDAMGNTIFDGRAFDRAHATREGEAWECPKTPEAFLADERSHTYQGKGFWARALMLLAGIGVNLLTGFLIMMFAYSVLGVQTTVNTNEIGGFTASSPAQEAGLQTGDAITAVNGTDVSSFSDIVSALQGTKAGETVELTYKHDGADETAQVKLSDEGLLGITAKVETQRLSVVDSARITWAYIAGTAEGVMQMLQPAHTMEVLDNSTSIVGISVMSAQAAESGPSTLLSFAALISFSLAFMNLLPIPPLDGGKLLIEVIQAVSRRQVPVRAQTYLSYAGVALFGILFIYMLRTDILRFL